MARAASAADFGLVYVLPGVGTSEDIVDLFAVELHLVFELVLDSEHVRAGLAEEAEVSHGALGEQNVRAGRTEKHLSILGLFCRRTQAATRSL